MPDAATAVANPSDATAAVPPAPRNDVSGNNAGRVTELRVSANLMTLDTGVFCVFPVPGSPGPDPVTGLPGVRITEAPAPGRPGTVNISTFRDDGWLEGAAALVRVNRGPAQVLVTIYQNPAQPREAAPRLQVMRLDQPMAAGAAVAAAAPAAVAAPQQAGAPPEAVAHVQGTGDVGGQIGDWIGTRGSKMWIEGFGLSPQVDIAPDDIEYQAVLGRGWLSPWVEGGKFCGSRGMALPLLGLKLRLKGAAADAFECTYSATFVDGSEVGPISAGESCEAESLAALEAFRIEFHPRASETALTPKTAARSPRSRSGGRSSRRAAA